MPKMIPTTLNDNYAVHNLQQGDFMVPYTEGIAATLSQTPPSTQEIENFMTKCNVPQIADTQAQITRIQQHRDQFDAFMNTLYESMDPADLEHIQTAQAGMGLPDSLYSWPTGLVLGLIIAFLLFKGSEKYRHIENRIQRGSITVGSTIAKYGFIILGIIVPLFFLGSYFGIKSIFSAFDDKEIKRLSLDEQKHEQFETSKTTFEQTCEELIQWLHMHRNFDKAIYRGPGCIFEFQAPQRPGIVLRLETIGGYDQGNVLVYTRTVINNGTPEQTQQRTRDMTDAHPSLTSQVVPRQYELLAQKPSVIDFSKLGSLALKKAKVKGTNGGNVTYDDGKEDYTQSPHIDPEGFFKASVVALESLQEKLDVQQIPSGTYIINDSRNHIQINIQIATNSKAVITRFLTTNTGKIKMVEFNKASLGYDREITIECDDIWSNTIQAGQELVLMQRINAVTSNLRNGQYNLNH